MFGNSGKIAIARKRPLHKLRAVTFRPIHLLALGFLALAGCNKPAPPVAPKKTQPTPAASATESPAPTPRPTPEDPNAIRIGFLAPMTGPQGSFGDDAILGANLAVEQINAAGGVLGHPIRLIVKDTRSLEEEAVAMTDALIDSDKVCAIIGEIASDRSLAAARAAQPKGIPVITPAATHEQVTAVGDCIFRVCYTDPFQGRVMAKFARSIDVTKAAILFDPANPYSAGLTRSFKNDFVTHAGQIVAEETYSQGAKDFTAQLTAIKNAQPEIVFLPAYYADAALIIQQARVAGITVPFLGTDGWDSQDFLKTGGDAVNNCYFTSHFSAGNTKQNVPEFVTAFQAKNNVPPPQLAALAYDAVKLTADAISRAGNTTPESIKTALVATKDFSGVTGKITFDESRNPKKDAVILRVEKGAFTYLETVEP